MVVQEKVLTDKVHPEQRRRESYTLVRTRAASTIQGPLTITVKPHPGDVIPHTLHSPAWQCRPHHGQVCLATGAGEGSCHIALLPRRVGDTQDLPGGEREQGRGHQRLGMVCMGRTARGQQGGPMFIHETGALPCYRAWGGSKGKPTPAPDIQQPRAKASGICAESLVRQLGTWQWRGEAEADWPGPALGLPPEAAQILTRPSPACAPPASPHPGPAERRCEGQSTSCPAGSCHHSRCRRRRSPARRARGQSGFSLGCMATGSPAPLGTMGSWSCWQGHQALGCQGPEGSGGGRKDTRQQWWCQ